LLKVITVIAWMIAAAILVVLLEFTAQLGFCVVATKVCLFSVCIYALAVA